jgi:hypothetical protein
MSTTLTGRIGGSSAIADPLTDLDAIEALTGTGLPARSATNTWALRTLAAPAAGIAVSNGDGAAGNPTLALANDLAALEALAATGLAARTASDTWAQRTIAASGAGLSVANGDGAAGNPTLTIDPAAVVAPAAPRPPPARPTRRRRPRSPRLWRRDASIFIRAPPSAGRMRPSPPACRRCRCRTTSPALRTRRRGG